MVAAARSRKTKIDALAATLGREPDEIATVVNLLTGGPRRGRIGVGWATLSAVRRPGVAGCRAHGDGGRARRCPRPHTGDDRPGIGDQARQAALGELFAWATATEADFVVRLLTDELRRERARRG